MTGGRACGSRPTSQIRDVGTQRQIRRFWLRQNDGMGWSRMLGQPGLLEVEGFDAEEFGGLAELFFDAQELVVLGDAVGAAGGAGLDLAGVGGHGDVGDDGVLGLAGAVAR